MDTSFEEKLIFFCTSLFGNRSSMSNESHIREIGAENPRKLIVYFFPSPPSRTAKNNFLAMGWRWGMGLCEGEGLWYRRLPKAGK